MSQYDLFGGTPPHEATATSLAAARAIAPSAATLREKVYRHIVRTGGATDEELERSLQMLGNTVRPRRRELVLMERIQDSGLERKTRSGRLATVWVAQR